MEDWNGIMKKRSNFEGKLMKDEDLEEEEDVWEVEMESEDSILTSMSKSRDYPIGSSSTWLTSSAPRMIPRVNIPSTAPHEPNKVVKQCSAPMDIPDWSKIYKKNTKVGSLINNDGIASKDVDNHVVDDGDGDIDDGDEMVPPHEWIAIKLARSQISPFSVYEGIGRTLKGRDLSKVRNTILTKTGFLE